MIPVTIAEDKIPLLHGVNGKFTANVDVTLPTDPLPVSPTAIAAASFSADGKAAIGNDVSLGVSLSTSVTLAALFKEETGAAPDLTTTFELAPSLTADNLIVALDLGGKADLSVGGSYKYSVLSATASLAAGVDARLVNTRVYKRAQASGEILADFVANLTTPGSVKEPPPQGQIAYLEFGGYLNFGASLAAGYSMKGTHNFQNVAELKLSETYQFSVTGKLSIAAKLAGRFSVEVQSADDLHAGDPGWVRVTVNRQRSRDLQIAADLSASATIDTGGLPATGKEFLGSLLGLRAKNWINQADSILSQAAGIHTAKDLTDKLDGLAQIYLSRYVNKAVDTLLPAEVQGLLGKLKTVVDSYTNAGDNAVALFDRYFNTIGTDLKPALAKIEALTSLDQFQGEIDPVLWNVLQQLTGGNVLDTILQKVIGIKTLQDGAANVLGFIQDEAHTEIRNFIAISKKEFDLDNIVGEIAKFDTVDKLKAQASDAANHVVERILGTAVAKLSKADFKNLTDFIQAVQKGEKGFFDKFDAVLKEAASQKFTADIGISYDNADERHNLIDVDIRLLNADGIHNAKGLAFLGQAGLGNFADILQQYDPAVAQLRAGTLTHKMSTSTGVKINIAGWHQSFHYQSVYQVVVNSEQQIRATSNGMLHVFTQVDLSASHDLTRQTNKHVQEMHSNFALRFIAESTTPTMTPDEKRYILEVITATAATYTNNLVDSDTTRDKLDRILLFAKTLGLDRKGANLQALFPILQFDGSGSLGAVEADYEVRFTGVGLSRLFKDPGPVDRSAISAILRMIVMSNYVGDPGLEPVAWLFCSNTVRDLALGNPGFVASGTLLEGISPFVIQNPFPTLTPDVQNSTLVRTLASTLFQMEQSVIEAFSQLHDAVQTGNITLDALQKAAKHFGDALNSFDSQVDLSEGTSNPIFAVFDRLIQLATPAAQARDSALSLKIGPVGAQKTLLFQLAAEPVAGEIAA